MAEARNPDNTYLRGYTVDVEKVKALDTRPESDDRPILFERLYSFITDSGKGHKVDIVPSEDENEKPIAMLVKAVGPKEDIINRPISPLNGPGKDYFKEIIVPNIRISNNPNRNKNTKLNDLLPTRNQMLRDRIRQNKNLDMVDLEFNAKYGQTNVLKRFWSLFRGEFPDDNDDLGDGRDGVLS